MYNKSTAKFELGKLVATRRVIEYINEAEEILHPYIKRHSVGDWGDACAEDKKVNEGALKNGGRLMSVYNLPDGKKIWIITEWNRCVTTILFPDEY